METIVILSFIYLVIGVPTILFVLHVLFSNRAGVNDRIDRRADWGNDE